MEEPIEYIENIASGEKCTFTKITHDHEGYELAFPCIKIEGTLYCGLSDIEFLIELAEKWGVTGA